MENTDLSLNDGNTGRTYEIDMMQQVHSIFIMIRFQKNKQDHSHKLPSCTWKHASLERTLRIDWCFAKIFDVVENKL